MTLLEIIKPLKDKTYHYEGEEQVIEMEEGWDQELFEDFEENMPTKQLPAEVKQLIEYTETIYCELISDLEFTLMNVKEYNIEAWLFDCSVGVSYFGENTSANIVVDPNNGEWEKVWIVSEKDKHAYLWTNSLKTFLKQKIKTIENDKDNEEQLLEYSLRQATRRDGKSVQNAKGNGDSVLRTFAGTVPEECVIFDLREPQLMEGFSWKHIPDPVEIFSHPTEYIWAMRTKPAKKNFFQRLFNL